MEDTPEPPRARLRISDRHREVLQLAALAAVAVAVFFVTRAVAANSREISRRDAEEWYRRGEASVAAGRLDEAIQAFRRANVKSRDNQTYMIALARAEVLNGDADAARQILITLRESAPEEAAINLQLARLARDRQDVPEALRFYRNALYAIWPADGSASRWNVRLELVRFLLSQHQIDRARSELLAAGTDASTDASRQAGVAALFAEAGDDTNALGHFQQALRISPENDAALAGAGQTAFRLGQYELAQRYLRRARDDDPQVRIVRDVVDMVLIRDPQAPRIGVTERRRRLVDNLTDAGRRMSECLARPASDTSAALTLQSQLADFGKRISQSSRLDQDDLEAGTALVAKAERDVVQRCGPPTSRDQALLLIGRAHVETPR